MAFLFLTTLYFPLFSYFLPLFVTPLLLEVLIETSIFSNVLEKMPIIFFQYY